MYASFCLYLNGIALRCYRADFVGAAGRQPARLDADVDAALQAALQAVELEYLLARGDGWEQASPLRGSRRAHLKARQFLG